MAQTLSIEEEIRSALKDALPRMQTDGGGISLLEVRSNGDVYLRMEGTCTFCPSREISARCLVENLKVKLPDLGPIIILGDHSEQIFPDFIPNN